MTNNGAVCAPRKVSGCTESFPGVYRSVGHQEGERKLIKVNFSGHIYRLRGAKILSKSLILILFGCWEGFWNMPTCFQMFVEVFAAIRGAKNEIKQKTSFFSPIPLLKSIISKNEKCRAKTLTFLWFQCIFLTNWVSKMGKPQVPVAPTHLGHLGWAHISV